MDTFRKWLNKPKSDDKSLLARFYHADRSLTAVASELDSFDGRAEPDRCSRLVTRLRQGQDKVLAITNLIMEELLGDERDVRAFRAKFPEEVLQENLGGQLWFGAECLAAGSSIMNREQESKEMRPLAQAVTKSLVNVRSLLREQCLRSNVPNSKKLHLDVNDATTEQLYESLKIFDRLFAEFELRYVSAMVQVKTKEEYEMQEMICVLFSETLQRALKLELIEQDKVDAFDPGLMFSIPRLAIITGLVVYPKGPLNMDMPAEELSEMFRPFRTILTKIRDLLRTLTKDELFQLQKLLCTNEDIHMKIPIGSSSIEAPIVDQHNNNNSSNQSINKKDNKTKDFQNTEATEVAGNSQTEAKRKSYRYAARSPSVGSSVSADSSIQPSTPHSSRSSSRSRTASHSIASTSTAASDTYISIADDVNWSDDDDDDDDDIDESNDIPSVDAADTDELSSDAIDEDDDQGILTADCASGFLIPNTNFGNLLQPHEIPLTGNFVASDDEFVARLRALGLEEADMPTSARMQSDQEYETSQRLNRLRLSDSSEESERQTTPTENDCGISASNCSSSCADDLELRGESSSIHHHHHHHHHHHRHNNNYHHRHHHHHYQTERHHQCAKSYNTKAKKRHSLSENLKSDTSSSADASASKMEKRRSSEGVSTSSSLSDADTSNGVLRAHGRMKFKNTENLLHRLFVCIAGVADQLQTNFASDLRQILRSVFLMNMSIAKEDLDIPEKTRESELFEFRASETDVIQQESGGSNQSIYSAEEVNAELDNVFNNNNNNRNRHSAGATVQRENIIDPTMSGVQLARSRSVGDENASTADNEAVATTSRRLSNSATTHTQPQITNTSYIQRKNSLSNNSSTTTTSASASESNSPVSERASHNNTTSHQNNESLNRRMSPPAWIPDDKAPRCMSCRTPFTAFRRRHHCRNCGGVFCGVCSNASTPLPKYGLTKAVRVCRECYMREILSSASNSTQQYSCTGVRTMHTSANSSTTAGGL